MMRIPLKVTYADGREQAVTVSAPDLIAFERNFDKPTTAIASGRMEYLWWACWHATKRAGLTEVDFDTWIAAVTDIADDLDQPTELVPLERTQPTGS